MSLTCKLNFDHKTLYINHETWFDLTMSKNTFALSTLFNLIYDVLARDGSVKILMPDGDRIGRSIDRKSEVHDLFAEVNTIRRNAGLELFSI